MELYEPKITEIRNTGVKTDKRIEIIMEDLSEIMIENNKVSPNM